MKCNKLIVFFKTALSRREENRLNKNTFLTFLQATKSYKYVKSRKCLISPVLSVTAPQSLPPQLYI